MKHVAVGILMREGRVLACQRRQTGRYPLKWEFPGGKIEPGETPRQALDRELHEELGIQVTATREFSSQEWIYPEETVNPGKDGAFHVVYFLVDGFLGELVSKAFEQIQWVTPSALLEMDILEGNRPSIEQLIRHVQQEQTT
jgi:8-oxo-dGTP diphosphatase